MDGSDEAAGDSGDSVNRKTYPDTASNGDIRNFKSSLFNSETCSIFDTNQLRLQIKKLLFDLQTEQVLVSQLRRRLIASEKQKLDAGTQSNKEIGSLQNQLVRLRTEIEKGEEARQNVCFLLNKTQKDLAQLTQLSLKNESVFCRDAEEMNGKMSSLTDALRRSESRLQSVNEQTTDTESRLQSLILEKERDNLRLHSELEICCVERNRLNMLSQQQQGTISDFGNRVHVFEREHKMQSEDLRRALSDVQSFNELEQRLKKELEDSICKVKSLEEIIEAERTAYSDTKYNCEILLLRVRELESSLDVEKSANMESGSNVDRLTKQLREQVQLNEKERKIKKAVLFQHHKMEGDYHTAKKQLVEELEGKSTEMDHLTKQFEVHQKRFTELRTELSKTKKRQIFVEDSYSSAFKELELLIETVDRDGKLKAPKSLCINKDTSSADTFSSNVVEKIRQMLLSNQQKVNAANEEKAKGRKQYEKLARELKSEREISEQKEKSLEKAQSNCSQAAKDITMMQSRCSKLEVTDNQLRATLECMVSSRNMDHNRIQALSGEIMELVKKQQIENKEKSDFLYRLYQLLVTGKALNDQRQEQLSEFCWSEFADFLYRQVSANIEALSAANDKLQITSESIKSKDETNKRSIQQHEEQLALLRRLAEDREAVCQVQMEELDEHYRQLIDDLQSRSKKSERLVDQAWEKTEVSSSVQQSLEAECCDLRRQLKESNLQASALLSACALLFGAFYPLCLRADALATQRHLLEEQMSVWDNCRERIFYLVNVLHEELGQSGKPERDNCSVSNRLRFRVGIIAVIAACRLQRLGCHGCRCLTTCNSVSIGSSVAVCIGEVEFAASNAKGSIVDAAYMNVHVPNNPPSPLKTSAAQSHLVSWLTSSALVESITGCMTDLTETVLQCKNGGELIEQRALVALVRSSVSRLINDVHHFFPSTSPPGPHDRRQALSSLFGRSLHGVLMGCNFREKGNLASSQELIITLQNYVLDLIQRLHVVEVERRQLLSELSSLKMHNSGSGIGQNISAGQEVNSVTMDKFDYVCKELSESFRREKAAQKLLLEQSQQLQNLTMNMSDTQSAEKCHSLTETSKIGEIKEELHLKSKDLENAYHHIAQLNVECKSIYAHATENSKAANSLAAEKDSLMSYIKSVSRALEEAKRTLIATQDSKLSENGNICDNIALAFSKIPENLDCDSIGIDSNIISPELIACQNFVSTNMNIHRHFIKLNRALVVELVSLRQHVDHLMRILDDCQHLHSNCSMASKGLNQNNFSNQQESSSTENYRPLREDSDTSLSASNTSVTLESNFRTAIRPLRQSISQTPRISRHNAGTLRDSSVGHR